MPRRLAAALTGGGRSKGSLPENRPLLLVSGATATVDRLAGHPHLGRLVQPRNGNSIELLANCGLWWAADNDCFQGLDPDEYLAMLHAIQQTDISRLLFVAVPDVVGDAYGTLVLFRAWLPALRKRRLPAALVAQDGLTPDAVPWQDIACLFIGGSTSWKLGPKAAALIEAARARGCWVHVGRCNSRRRIRYAVSLGADSLDGTGFSMFPDTHLPWGLAHCAAQQTRLWKE